jgi:hypothetical protein
VFDAVDAFRSTALTTGELLDALADAGLWATRARRRGWTWHERYVEDVA